MCVYDIINIHMTNGLSHPLWMSPLFGGASGVFFIFISFFDENHVSKQNSPRWDAAFCGVISGAFRFAYVPQKGRQAYIG